MSGRYDSVPLFPTVPLNPRRNGRELCSLDLYQWEMGEQGEHEPQPREPHE